MSYARHDGKKVLMVFTSHSKLGDTGKPTGWYLPEAAHPHKVFAAAGLDVTFASPQGGAAPLDPGSVDASKDDAICMVFHADKEIETKLKETVPLAGLQGADFHVIFFVGGFGVMWDFPDDTHVQRLVKEVYESGGLVSAVCHGPVALTNVKLSDGSLLMKGRSVTAFTNAEEDYVDLRSVVPFTCEDKYNEIGAFFSDGGVFKPNIAISGRVITGQNPPSSELCAKAVVAALTPKKVVMVFTNYGGEPGKPTGWYLPEAAHPYENFKDAGFEITFASPKGGAAALDPASVDASKEDAICVAFNNNPEVKRRLESTVPLSSINGRDISAVFFVGGFGTMWDFPDDENVQRVGKEVFESGGVVSAVCHGPCAFVNTKLSDGSLLMKDKRVTAFTNAEEDYVDMRRVVPFTCEDKFNEIGAKFSDGGVFLANVAVDGRIVTGQNPPSADACAKAVVEVVYQATA